MADLGNKSIKDVFMESAVELKLDIISTQIKKVESSQEDIKEMVHSVIERVTKLETREESRDRRQEETAKNGDGFFKDIKTWIAIIALLFGVGNTGAQIIPEAGGKNQDTEMLREIFMKYLNIPKPPVSGYYPQAYPIDPGLERPPKKP